MKPIRALGTLVLVAFAIFLVACGKTNNSSTTNAAAAVCTTNAYGQSVDQYGRPCAGATANNACFNASYNPTTGQYINVSTGQPVSCANSTYYQQGNNSLPYYGNYGGQSFAGCSGWTAYTGAYYVPVDVGYGQLICLNVNYLTTYMPTVNWSQIAAYQVPIYTCSGYSCGGGSYGGYNYGCNFQLSGGLNFLLGEGVSANIGASMCIPSM